MTSSWFIHMILLVIIVNETQQMTTDDGYILEMHRIPHSTTGNSGTLGRPVYLQHGLFDASSTWVITPSDRSLAFRLADLGYDVWLGNYRGNTYSSKHTTLDPTEKAFWRFSADEMGFYDTPAMINYVLNTTNREKLLYIGHSLGGGAFFMSMIDHPELNDKIEMMIALAPAVSVAHLKSPLILASTPFIRQLAWLWELLIGTQFLGTNTIGGRFIKRFCNLNTHRVGLCRNALFTYSGYTYNIDLSLMPVIDYHDPAGSSIRTFNQYSQNYFTGIQTFQKYDFGPLTNWQRYGQLKPPKYSLKAVTCPVYMFYGLNDYLISPKDAQWVALQLGNLKQFTQIQDPLYSHFDFVWATDNNRLLNDQVIALLPSASS